MQVERIIFCLFLPIDVELYQQYMQVYFPVEPPADHQGAVNTSPQPKEGSEKSVTDGEQNGDKSGEEDEGTEVSAKTEVPMEDSGGETSASASHGSPGGAGTSEGHEGQGEKAGR